MLHKVHFIGIGGISMSALAQILASKGHEVSGSDCTESAITEKLKKSNIKVTVGHSAENVQGADIVVYTAAIDAVNEELCAARNMGIDCYERADFLGLLMRNYKTSIGVAGTHGKTTATSMLTCVAVAGGLDPTALIGGELSNIGGNLRLGSEDYLILESCEYVNSFLKFNPQVELLLNLEEDHLDFFDGLEDIKHSFELFMKKIPPEGFAAVNYDDLNLRSVMERVDCRCVTFGLSGGDYTAVGVEFNADGFPKYRIMRGEEELGQVELSVAGVHNVFNSLGVFALAHTLGLSPQTIIDGLCEFRGTGRRFDYKGEFKGVRVYDDYAHHPTEIKATLAAAAKLPHKKLWCVFQPHTYSRTKALLKDFQGAFAQAERVIITDIYAAREPFDESVHAADISAGLDNGEYIKSFSEIATLLKECAESGDLIFTMGAGDVFKIADMLIK